MAHQTPSIVLPFTDYIEGTFVDVTYISRYAGGYYATTTIEHRRTTTRDAINGGTRGQRVDLLEVFVNNADDHVYDELCDMLASGCTEMSSLFAWLERNNFKE